MKPTTKGINITNCHMEKKILVISELFKFEVTTLLGPHSFLVIRPFSLACPWYKEQRSLDYREVKDRNDQTSKAIQNKLLMV